MGWWPFTSSSTPTPTPTNPPKSSDGAFIAPDRTARERCYDSRDRFFACLDQHGIIDSVSKDKKGEAERLCGTEEMGMRKECVASWVTYFKQRRIMEYNKQKQMDKLEKENAQRVF